MWKKPDKLPIPMQKMAKMFAFQKKKKTLTGLTNFKGFVLYVIIFSCFKVILKPACCEAQIRVVAFVCTTYHTSFIFYKKSNVAKLKFVHSKSIFYFKKRLNLSDFFFHINLGPHFLITSILKSLYLQK